jgi:hypothetical protein
MKKNCIALTAMLVASSMTGMDAVTYLQGMDWFETISVSQTNVTLKFKESSLYVRINNHKGELISRSEVYISEKKDWVLTPDQTIIIEDYSHPRGWILLKPVSFKNQQKGFSINELKIVPLTNHVAYLALSDTLAEVGERDVQKVMEGKEWKRAGKQDETNLPQSSMSKAEAVAYLQRSDWFDSVLITPTNLVLRFKRSEIHIQDHLFKSLGRSENYMSKNEDLVLTPNRAIILGGFYNVRPIRLFSPVSFKNQQMGFRISEVKHLLGTNHIAYLVLCDIPIEAGEEDVEMIMMGGEWVKYENPQPVIMPEAEPASPVKKGRATAFPPSREGNETERLGETPSPYRLWLYVGIPLCCLLAIVYFLRRKWKTKT